MAYPVIHGPYIIIFLSRIYSLRRRKDARTNMGDFLATYYPCVKSLHVISVIAWMAGLFYLPRLYVYHVEQVEPGSRTDAMFQVMERRLLKAIINPASVATWAVGRALVFTPGMVSWDQLWPWMKAASVLGMTWFHPWLGWRRKDFLAGTNKTTGRQYRMMNEVPTLLLVVIVCSVIVKFCNS